MRRIDLDQGGDYWRLEKKETLERRIAEGLGTQSHRVCLTNGANGALEFLLSRIALETFRAKGRAPNAVIDIPNYQATLHFLEASGYTITKVPRQGSPDAPTYGFPQEAFLAALASRPDLVVLTTPNNPTGIPIADEDMYRVIDATDAIVLVDRTGLNTAKEVSTGTLLKDFAEQRVIVIHSCSKSYNIGAERVGFYIVTSDELSTMFAKHEDEARVGATALDLLEQALDNPLTPTSRRETLLQSRALLDTYAVSQPDFRFTETSSNFCVAFLERSAALALSQHYQFKEVEEMSTGAVLGCRLNLFEPENLSRFLLAYKAMRLQSVDYTEEQNVTMR